MKEKFYFLSILFTLITSICIGQTCCSGGVPLSGNIGLPETHPHILQFSLSYDLNVLKNLKEGSNSLNDNSRIRKTKSILLNTGYTISKKFSIELLTSIVRQERIISAPGFASNESITNGFGDLVLLFKYNLPIFNSDKINWLIGIGPKIPTGPSDLKNEDGFTIIADLQPGSGAWDMVFWSKFRKQNKIRKSLSYGLTLVHGIKGKNNKYLGSQVYQFGNETQITANISNAIVINKLVMAPSLILRFRRVQRDLINEIDLPNTGGNFLFFLPGLNTFINQHISVYTRFQIPILAKVDGIQLSPNYRFNIGGYININTKRKNIEPNKLELTNNFKF